MKASFTTAIRYWITASCVSPLRTGGAGNQIDQVLTTANGYAMLQAASIAGAMKAWDPDLQLLGSEDDESALRISDAVFDASVLSAVRPRLHIDGATGTAAKGGKFDIACLPTGSSCRFELLWRGSPEDSKETYAIAARIERYLSAIHSGEILFGAQKSNGFGRMQLSVRRRIYNMFDAADLEAWLNDAEDGAPLALAEEAPKKLRFAVSARSASLLVKASTGIGSGKDKLDGVQLEENGKPIIPGSSLKGAIRSHMKRIAPFLGIPQAALDRLMGRGAKSGTDTGVAGKLYFSDASLRMQNPPRKVTRIRINRVTGGTMRKALIAERPVGGEWVWEIELPAQEQAGALLLLYALRDLGLGMYQLGGTKAIGRGTVDRIAVQITAGEKTAALLVENGQVSLQDADGIVAAWEQSMGGDKA